MCVSTEDRKKKKSTGSPGTEVQGGCILPHTCAENQYMFLNTESFPTFLNEKVSKLNYIKYFRHPSILSMCILILAYPTKCPAF